MGTIMEFRGQLDLLFGLVGVLVGSFLNVVIYRVPTGQSLSKPRSNCPSCRSPIRALDNLPVLSWLILGRRCRACRAPISARYPFVEILTGVAFAAAAHRARTIEEAVFVALAFAVFIAITFIDVDHRRVPNRIVLPATAVSFVWLALLSLLTRSQQPFTSAVISASTGFLLLLVIALVSGGMGFGDVKLAAFLGLVVGRFGVGAFVVALFAAFMLGGIVGIGALLSGQAGRKSAIPFAPMLCGGAVIGIFVGARLFGLWLGR